METENRANGLLLFLALPAASFGFPSEVIGSLLPSGTLVSITCGACLAGAYVSGSVFSTGTAIATAG